MIVQETFLENLQERSAGTYLIDTLSMQNELRSGIINFWLVVYGISQFWLVVIPVERFLARGDSW